MARLAVGSTILTLPWPVEMPQDPVLGFVNAKNDQQQECHELPVSFPACKVAAPQSDKRHSKPHLQGNEEASISTSATGL